MKGSIKDDTKYVKKILIDQDRALRRYGKWVNTYGFLLEILCSHCRSEPRYVEVTYRKRYSGRHAVRKRQASEKVCTLPILPPSKSFFVFHIAVVKEEPMNNGLPSNSSIILRNDSWGFCSKY